MPHQSVCSGKGVTFETSAIHPTSRAKNIPYQPLGIKTDNRLTRQRKKKIISYSKNYSSSVQLQLQHSQ